ncbi:LacI family DNA-binding transcriptional regulator [Peterkaempfera bronchialis]|uniref:LacI family transcriptional regulator n=1 Tax=Peterkaempfera bronchialis TaxID=2126346 RepID=A0A345ST39_9ACTN|nr:LacI family DNA-binding transcriptional regulator [Peterkaempfera bronchialis]AXI76894.1 LacI family transcriptional regulator [Peterkaempfera bronchialis]
MKRPTMADIARRAGVTKAAVSFALNGRPGVSEPTRRRILAIADELGWQPNSAARALSDGRAGAFGLVVDRPARMLGLEPFFMQLISGIQAELSIDGTPLLFTVAEDQQAEIETYRSWWAQRRVDGVFLVDMQVADARVPVLEELGMPTVVIGAPIGNGRLPAVWSDDAAAAHTALQHLAALGHRRVARVCGPAHLRHTEIRSAAIERLAPTLGMECTTVATDYSADEGAAAARSLLTGQDPPTAILFDSDLTAVSGLTAAQALGLRVPGDVSIVGWGDSALCELVHPPLTALSRDVAAHGGHAARLLRTVAAGTRVAHVQDASARLALRGSTGPAPVRVPDAPPAVGGTAATAAAATAPTAD